MLLTVTRTVAITFPFQFHKINDNSVIVVAIFAGHCALGVLEIIAWQTVRTSFIYVADLGYCAKTIPHPGVLMAENIIYSVEVGFPAVVIVLSFMISTVGLAIKGRDARAMDSQRASVTIASFTCLFLVCTMPFFVVMVMYLTDQKYQLDSQVSFLRKVIITYIKLFSSSAKLLTPNSLSILARTSPTNSSTGIAGA